LLLLAPNGGALAATPGDQKAPCVANFAKSGSFFSGQKFRTIQEFPDLDRYTAFDRVARTIASSGYQNVQSDKELGTVNAQGAASFSGRSYSVSATVRRFSNTGASVELVAYLPGGLTVKTQAILDEFCRLLKAAVTAEVGSPGVGDRSTTPASPAQAGPVLEVLEPQTDELRVETPVLRVRALARSESSPIAAVRVQLNGVTLADLKPGQSATTRSRSVELEITLQPGENLVTFKATDTERRSTTAERRIFLQPEPTSTVGVPGRPDLVLLAIGISDYSDPSLRLKAPESDAQAVAALFMAQQGIQFGRTFVKTLPNPGERAGRAEILAALDWFRRQGTPQDVRLLYLSGHGTLDIDGEFYFLSQDQIAGADPELGGIRWDRFARSLSTGGEHTALILDACHSGRTSGQDFTRAIVKANSLVVYASSTNVEASLESTEWGHGAFTMALLAGLRGAADGFGGGRKDGKIDTEELGAWLKRKVPELTGDRQHPTFDSGGRAPFDLVRAN
jgi:outer membrane lipoprotein SlyB